MADVDIRTWSPTRLVEIVGVGLGEPPEIPIACVPILVLCYRGLINQLGSLTAPERELLCTTMIRFLTFPRTSEQFLRLRKEMDSGTCCCGQGPEILRNVPHPLEDDKYDCEILEHLLVWMSMFLIAALGDRSQLYPRRIKHRRIWPRSSADFLSNNPAASLHMLGVWVHVQLSEPRQAAMMITFIKIIFACVCTHALTAFLQSPMLWCWIHAVIEVYEPTSTPPFHILYKADTSPADFIATIKFVQLLEMEMFDEELEISVANHPSLTVEEITMALCKGARALEDFRDNEESTVITERMRHDWNHLLARLVMRIPAARPTDLPDSTSQVITVLDSENKTPAGRLYHNAFSEAWTHRCYGPFCLSTHISPGVKFKICAACQRAAYCSRSCQKLAWRYSGAAHRDVCAIYRVYANVWNTARHKPASLRWGSQDSTGTTAGTDPFAFLDQFSPDTLQAAHINVQNLRATQHKALRTSENAVMDLSDVPVEKHLELQNNSWIGSIVGARGMRMADGKITEIL
jgi:hypothetical protein